MNAHENTAAVRTPARPGTPKKGRLGFRVIGAMKLASAGLLVAAGFGIFRMMNRDLGEALEGFVTKLHLDPENRLVHETVSRVANIDRAHLRALGVGTFFYAGLHTVEGTGLILLKPWAEYLTVVATASLLPLELYEIARKPTPIRFLVLVVNVAVLVYVVVMIRRRRAAAEN